VLLSSEIGSEGLDFQFCDALVNYDIPWNPMRIEQRIGRIDRYGQKSETVAIWNLVTPGTVDFEVYERCLLRIGVFAQSIGGCEEILGEIAREIRSVGEDMTLSPAERQARLQQLAENDIRLLHEQDELEKRQTELFEIRPVTRGGEDDISEAIWLAPPALERLVHAYLMRLFPERESLLGAGPLKTLRLESAAGQGEETLFVLPYAKKEGVDRSSEAAAQLQKAGPEVLMFLNHIEELIWEDG
jgi:hypothetical protein